MGLFGKKTASPHPELVVADLVSRMSHLESDMRMLQTEYLDTHDKMKRLMSRVAKRAAIDGATVPELALPDIPETSGLDPISAKIHARRGDGIT